MLRKILFLFLFTVLTCALAVAFAVDVTEGVDKGQESLGRESMLTKAQSKGLERIVLPVSRADHPTIKRSSRSIFLEEDFEAATFPPAGWDTINTDPGYGWHRGIYTGGGTYAAMVTWHAPGYIQDEWLLTPEMDVSGAASELKVEFWMLKGYTYPHDFKVYVSTDGGSSWTQEFDSYDVPYPAHQWYFVSVDLSAYAGIGNIKIAFQYYGEDADLFGLDDVSVNDDPPPIGRCCYGDPFAPNCEDDVTEDSCSDLGGYWAEGLNCTDNPCPLHNIQPSDDMYTDPDYGSGHAHPIAIDQLWTADWSAPCGDHHQRIMMRFDLSYYMGKKIDSAYLNIYRFFRCPNHFYTNCDFFHITQDWSEDTWDELVHINHDPSPWKTYNFGPDNDWYRIDIKEAIQDWLDGSVDNYGFVIQAKYGERWSKFFSKEAQSSMRPYLDMYLPDNFVCGDVNGDDVINIFDVTFLISYLYIGGPAPDPIESADVNSDSTVNIFDITYLIAYLYMEGPDPDCP